MSAPQIHVPGASRRRESVGGLERAYLRRLLWSVAVLAVTLFAWTVERELSRIADASMATEAHMSRLDDRLGAALLGLAEVRAGVAGVEMRVGALERIHEMEREREGWR